MNELKMMAPQTQILFFLLLLYSSRFLALCVAKPFCPPSSCGIISNITSPFRLRTDPNDCGDRRAELVCENNVTFLYLHSHKYYVKNISYTEADPIIRLADASINNNTCSFPTTSSYEYAGANGINDRYYYVSTPSYISFLSCPHPLKKTSLSSNTTHCQTSNSSNSRFTYIRIGTMKASDVPEACRIDGTPMTSFPFKYSKNVSLEEIHQSLLYGFELYFCSSCEKITRWERFMYFYYKRLRRPFRIILVILVVSGAVVNPIMSIIAAAIILVFLLSIADDIRYAIQRSKRI